MYLDALRVKAGVAKNTYFQANTRVPPGKNSFEAANKANFDSLERLATSEDLRANDRRMLLTFIKHYKLSWPMETEEDFDRFIEAVEEGKLRTVFPKGGDVDKRILQLNDEHRRRLRQRAETQSPSWVRRTGGGRA
jgi:hypothetical protein